MERDIHRVLTEMARMNLADYLTCRLKVWKLYRVDRQGEYA